MKSSLLIFPLFLSACVTGPQIDRVQVVTEYVTVPEQLLVCPESPELSDDFIVSLQTETDYNEKYVLPLYLARERCADSIQSIRDYNQSILQEDKQ